MATVSFLSLLAAFLLPSGSLRDIIIVPISPLTKNGSSKGPHILFSAIGSLRVSGPLFPFPVSAQIRRSNSFLPEEGGSFFLQNVCKYLTTWSHIPDHSHYITFNSDVIPPHVNFIDFPSTFYDVASCFCELVRRGSLFADTCYISTDTVTSTTHFAH